MLTTADGHELSSFPFLAGRGVTAWRVVTMDLRVPYVFISYATKEGRGWLSQTSIFWRHEDVLSFCRDIKGDKSRKILDISLLLFRDQGANGGWSWTPVKEVFAAQFKDSGIDFPLYITVSGEKFSGLSGFGSHETKGLEMVFPTTKRRNKAKHAG